MDLYINLIIRLVLACVLGGIIGYERESMHRPAGFRTHILVCVGSALVMVTSEYIFKQYIDKVSLDPTRLGAQVISGIGFLGAGTIIRDGFSVKGLTTAASLWAVSCVGIAAGIGFYEGAVAATILIFITLIILRKMEFFLSSKKQFRTLYIQAANKPGQLGLFSEAIERHGIPVKSIEFIHGRSDKTLTVKVVLGMLSSHDSGNLLNDLHEIDGVQSVIEE